MRSQWGCYCAFQLVMFICPLPFATGTEVKSEVVLMMMIITIIIIIIMKKLILMMDEYIRR